MPNNIAMLEARNLDEFGQDKSILRQQLGEQPNVRFVDLEEYKTLIIDSRLQLARADMAKAGVRGLLDEKNGDRYYIEEEKISNTKKGDEDENEDEAENNSEEV